MFIVPINISGVTPTAAAGTTVIGNQFGLDFDVWTMKLVQKQDAGGTLDIVLQTQDQENGPWSDIAHLTQLAAGAATTAVRLTFRRGFGAPATPTLVNAADNTPALTAGQILPWANGKSLRCIVTPGAGATGTGSVTITGMATQSGQ